MVNEMAAKIFSFQEFDDVFSFDRDCYYDAALCQTINRNKKTMLGLLVEKVMKDIGIKRPQKYYPPKDNECLRNLHREIIKSTLDDHHKISVLYYILLHIDAQTNSREYSGTFAAKSFLPEVYQITMKGFWYMDQGEFDDALEYLTHPSLTPTYPEEILELLIKGSHNDLTLALAYYHTIQPALTNQIAIEYLFTTLARGSVTEAFYFGRGQPEYVQRHTFEILVSNVLNNSPPETIADRSVELVNLPFNTEEEQWFENYLLYGEGMAIKKAKDTVLFRRIATGNFSESFDVKPGNSRAIGGLDWNSLTNAVENGLGPRLDV